MAQRSAQILDAQAMRLRNTEDQALRADHSHVAQTTRSCYAYIRFCSLLPFNRRLRPDVLHARPARRRGRLGGEEPGNLPYGGTAGRTFERSFQLAEHVEVKGASLENGLLHVDLVREIPEAKKPRQIQIGNKTKIV